MNLKSNALHMAVGFLGMGAWAVFANRHHPLPQALLAGLVQGTMSAIITLFLKRMIEALSQRLPGLAALILPPLLAVAASIGLLSLIHSLAGTPEILATIAVPVTVTVIYSTTYCFALWRARYA
jgi:hypothetical protein